MGEKRVEVVNLLGLEWKVATDLAEEDFAKIVDMLREKTERLSSKFPDARAAEILFLVTLELGEELLNVKKNSEREKRHIDTRLNGVIELLKKGLKGEQEREEKIPGLSVEGNKTLDPT